MKDCANVPHPPSKAFLMPWGPQEVSGSGRHEENLSGCPQRMRQAVNPSNKIAPGRETWSDRGKQVSGHTRSGTEAQSDRDTQH